MNREDFSSATEALRNVRQSQAELDALKEILMNWKLSEEDEGSETDLDVYGQYDGWMVILSSVVQRLECSAETLIDITDKHWPSDLGPKPERRA